MLISNKTATKIIYSCLSVGLAIVFYSVYLDIVTGGIDNWFSRSGKILTSVSVLMTIWTLAFSETGNPLVIDIARKSDPSAKTSAEKNAESVIQTRTIISGLMTFFGGIIAGYGDKILELLNLV